MLHLTFKKNTHTHARTRARLTALFWDYQAETVPERKNQSGVC